MKETSQPAVANVAGDDQPAGLRVQLSEPSDDKAAGVELIGLSPSELRAFASLLTTPRVRAARCGCSSVRGRLTICQRSRAQLRSWGMRCGSRRVIRSVPGAGLLRSHRSVCAGGPCLCVCATVALALFHTEAGTTANRHHAHLSKHGSLARKSSEILRPLLGTHEPRRGVPARTPARCRWQ